MIWTLTLLNVLIGISTAFHVYVTLGFLYPAIGLRKVGRKKYHPVIIRWIGLHRPVMSLLFFDALGLSLTYVAGLRWHLPLGPAWLLPVLIVFRVALFAVHFKYHPCIESDRFDVKKRGNRRLLVLTPFLTLLELGKGMAAFWISYRLYTLIV